MIFSIVIYPMLYSIYMSFHRLKIVGTREIEFVGLSNFIDLLHDPAFTNASLLAIRYVVIAASFEILLGLAMALVLNTKVKGTSVARVLITIPIVLTPVIVGIFWKMILHSEVGYLNQVLSYFNLPVQNWIGNPETAIYATAMVDIWEWTPFVALILLASMQAIPEETLEAAAVYGASGVQTFRYVTLPLMTKGIFIAALLRVIDAARIFDQVYVLTRGGPAMSTDYVSIFIYRVGLEFFNVGYASAASWIYLIVISTVITLFIKGARIKV